MKSTPIAYIFPPILQILLITFEVWLLSDIVYCLAAGVPSVGLVIDQICWHRICKLLQSIGKRGPAALTNKAIFSPRFTHECHQESNLSRDPVALISITNLTFYLIWSGFLLEFYLFLQYFVGGFLFYIFCFIFFISVFLFQ